MDLFKLSRIDEELDSSEVAALCFLCIDILSRKRLEKVNDGKELFMKLEERGLMEDHFFLSQLLNVIRRADLLSLLETDSRQPEDSFGPETDAHPVLSDYRVMLYQIHEDLTQENFEKMKFLLGRQLGRGQIESCKTALDMFGEMERAGLLSSTNLEKLVEILCECDLTLVEIVLVLICFICVLLATSLSVELQSVVSDAQPNTVSPSLRDTMDYYELTHNPRGVCKIINNEHFLGLELKDRPGTLEDEKALSSVFSSLGFEVEVCNDMTAQDIRDELAQLGRRNFFDDDALVVCVLSHGELGCVFGTDEQKVSLREITQPFNSRHAPTLAGKPKLFFIQACQGNDYQRGAMPCPPRPRVGENNRSMSLEEDAGPVHSESVPWDADFLVGMATVPQCKSFRNTYTGSIYIQELCRQLREAVSRQEDILTVLTRVNREVSRGEYRTYKQMPEPKYTLTKKLVLTFV
uniref:Caspase-8 n=1 Tax=Myripristis murdjan TaxID=586833 RepID=A0A667YM94_9TELE